MKQYIYRCRCDVKNPNINAFKAEIIQTKNIEKYNATVNGKLDKYSLKWENIRMPSENSI